MSKLRKVIVGFVAAFGLVSLAAPVESATKPCPQCGNRRGDCYCYPAHMPWGYTPTCWRKWPAGVAECPPPPEAILGEPVPTEEEGMPVPVEGSTDGSAPTDVIPLPIAPIPPVNDEPALVPPPAGATTGEASPSDPAPPDAAPSSPSPSGQGAAIPPPAGWRGQRGRVEATKSPAPAAPLARPVASPRLESSREPPRLARPANQDEAIQPSREARASDRAPPRLQALPSDSEVRPIPAAPVSSRRGGSTRNPLRDKSATGPIRPASAAEPVGNPLRSSSSEGGNPLR
jgi:hypothetical protein